MLVHYEVLPDLSSASLAPAYFGSEDPCDHGAS